jgi:glucan 1,3-beta-glucosidase
VLGLIPFIAQNYPHLNVYLGIWESSKYRSATEEQMTKAIELANKYPNIVEYVIVGNECLDQDFADGAVTVDQLIADINKVKKSVPANVKVTTCLGFHSGLNPQKMEDGSPNPYYRPGNDYGKRIMQQSKADSLMFTVYPFYGKVEVSKGKQNTKYWYDYALANVANGKPVILGEVGWPSAGKPDNGAAVSSVENEKIYTTDMINAVKDGKVGSTFLFEAFDEPWKHGSQWEPHWGLWDQNGNPKFPIPSGL